MYLLIVNVNALKTVPQRRVSEYLETSQEVSVRNQPIWLVQWLSHGTSYLEASCPPNILLQSILSWTFISLVPRPLPDFISQPWKKIGRRPGIKTTSRTGNGGLGQYVTWTRFVLTESTIFGPWRSFDPSPSPEFSQRLRDKIWEGPGDESRVTDVLPRAKPEEVHH